MSPLRIASCALLLCSLVACGGAAPLHPRAVELNRAGADALARGDLATAEARLALALEYHPRFVEALANLGLVEMQRGNLARARVLLERALRINGDLAQPHHGLGVLEERERRPDLAAEHYRDALRVDPGFAPARANLARLLFAAGKLDDAREQLARLLEASPRDPGGHAALVETLLRLDRVEEADRALERALALLPATPELTLLVARRELRAGLVDAALARLAPLAEGDDDVARAARAWTAAAHLAAGRAGAAIDWAGRALALDRHDAVATHVVGLAHAT